jgi:hypothetical protein
MPIREKFHTHYELCNSELAVHFCKVLLSLFSLLGSYPLVNMFTTSTNKKYRVGYNCITRSNSGMVQCISGSFHHVIHLVVWMACCQGLQVKWVNLNIPLLLTA